MSYRPMPAGPTVGAHAPAPAGIPYGTPTELRVHPAFPTACFMTCREPYLCMVAGCSSKLSAQKVAEQLQQFPKSVYVAPDWDPA